MKKFLRGITSLLVTALVLSIPALYLIDREKFIKYRDKIVSKFSNKKIVQESKPEDLGTPIVEVYEPEYSTPVITQAPTKAPKATKAPTKVPTATPVPTPTMEPKVVYGGTEFKELATQKYTEYKTYEGEFNKRKYGYDLKTAMEGVTFVSLVDAGKLDCTGYSSEFILSEIDEALNVTLFTVSNGDFSLFPVSDAERWIRELSFGHSENVAGEIEYAVEGQTPIADVLVALAYANEATAIDGHSLYCGETLVKFNDICYKELAEYARALSLVTYEPVEKGYTKILN